MGSHKASKIVSILMESPLYLTLSIEERRSLIARLEESYPLLFDEEEEDGNTAHNGGWKELIH